MPFGDKYGIVVHVDIFMTHMRTDSVPQRRNILVVNSKDVSTNFYNRLSNRKHISMPFLLQTQNYF